MNELAPVKDQTQLISFTPEQVELIKRTVAKGATNDELSLFLHVCQKSGLDPFAKQIYAIKRKDRRSNTEVMSIQTGIDGYRVVAERTKQYAPGKEPTYIYDKDNRLISATAHINKLVGDKWFEVSATAFHSEYAQDGNFMWGKMPHVMLAKCAEALALRRAFPNELSGLYTQEEMAQADNGSQVQMPKRKTVDTQAEPRASAPVIDAGERVLHENTAVPSGESRTPIVEPEIPFADAPPAEGEQKTPFANRKINRAQQQLLFVKMREQGLEEVHLKKAMEVLFDLHSTSALTVTQFEKLLDLMSKGAIRGEEAP